MAQMTNTVKVLTWLLSTFFIYLFIAYTEWSFNIAQWSIIGRWVIVIFSVYAFPIKPKKFIKA